MCTVLFFNLAILFDYMNTKISSGTNQPGMVDESQINKAFMPETVRAETIAANQVNLQNPIQCRNIYKKFNNTFFALQDVNICLRPGEILGLIGPNGAGKSTMFNIVSNYLTPTMGSVLYNGLSLEDNSTFYEQTGLCAQDDIIWPELSVDQHLKFYATMKGVDLHTIEQWKDLMGLSGFGSFSSINLSTGMKRKLCYIISMMSNPLYKFLDEPTSGLDPVSRKLMRKLINS